MVKLYRIVLCILCLLAAATINMNVAFAQDTSELAIKEGSGEIVSVDPITSSVVVKILTDETGGSYKEVSLLVDDRAMITGQASTLTISDLKMGNKVTVVYETTADNKNIARSIMVR